MNNWWLDFVDSRYLELVGWSLINSLWQGMIIAAFLWVFLKTAPKFLSASLRYIAGLVSQLLIVGWTLVSIFKSNSPEVSGKDIEGHLLFSFSNISGYTQDITWIEKITNFIHTSLPLFMAFWFFGVMIFLIRIAGGLSYLNKLRRSTRSVSKELSEMANSLSKGLGISQKYQVLESRMLKVPVVIGHIQPLILLPVGMLTTMTLNEIKGILAHELAHIKRYDYLVNIIQSVLEAAYFFNPFVWWISALIREEREHACDDLAIACIEQPKVYAESLIKVSEQQNNLMPRFSPSILGSKRNSLLNRVERIMNKEMKNKPMNWLPAIILVVALVIPAFMIAKETKYSNPNGVNLVAGAGIELLSFGGVEDDFASVSLVSSLDTQKYDTIPDQKEVELDEDADLDLDEDRAVDVDIDIDPDLDMAFDFDLAVAPMIDVNIPPLPPMAFNIDTFPESLNKEEWEAYSQRLRVEMEEFQVQMQRFHQEFNEQFRDRFREWEFENQEEIEELRDRMHDEMKMVDMEHLRRVQEEVMRELEESNWQKELDNQMKEMQEKMDLIPNMEEYLQQMEYNLTNELEHLKGFEKELNSMLIEDGYISEGEEVNIEFNDDEVIVNDSALKDKHQKKYLELRKKYFPRDDGKFRYKIH
jgi:beta-lactamase regulating signal transducer with metallopeptidase domain